jgi:ParB family chromosome partitioning protein
VNVESIPLSSIVVSRERFREATGDMDGLRESLEYFGQLQPIIVEAGADGTYSLVAGFRRVSAARALNWTTIAAVRTHQLDELFSREVELEENIQREQMTWQERAKALTELNRIRQERDPNWTQGMTAALAGGKTAQRDVSEAVMITKLLPVFPELQRADSIRQAVRWARERVKSINRIAEVASAKDEFAEIEDRLWLGDSVELIKNITDESFHAIITDPPFGIDYDDQKRDTSSALSSYEDSKASYERILTIAPELHRVLKPDSWLVWFLGHDWFERCKGIFRDAGFLVDPVPIVWDRSDGRTFCTYPDRWFTKAYDIALHCVKGNPILVQKNLPNIIRVTPVSVQERELTVERPVGLYQELIRRLTIPGQIVADFFAGSGSCLAAAAALKRRWWGCELNPERRAVAIKKIKAHTAD